MSKKGKFIVIEGGEGAGKTSVIEHLREKFIHKGDIVFTREPGGTKIAEQIRGVLMDKSNKEMSALTELFLFCGARAQHIEELIAPSIRFGKNVISDRFYFSTIAYQIFGREKMDLLNHFLSLNKVAKQGVEPDVAIWLDVSPEVGLSRREKSQEGKSTRFDEERLRFHRKVREGFDSCFRRNHIDSFLTTTWHKINTDNLSLENVKEKVISIVGKILNF